jgi:hypothetical protein
MIRSKNPFHFLIHLSLPCQAWFYLLLLSCTFTITVTLTLTPSSSQISYLNREMRIIAYLSSPSQFDSAPFSSRSPLPSNPPLQPLTSTHSSASAQFPPLDVIMVLDKSGSMKHDDKHQYLNNAGMAIPALLLALYHLVSLSGLCAERIGRKR